MNSNSNELLFIFVPILKMLLQRYFSSIFFLSTDLVCIAGGSESIRESSRRIGKHQGASGSSEKEKSFNGNGGEPNSVQAGGTTQKSLQFVATIASVEETVRTAT